MEVTRCGFFIDGNQLYQKNVKIEWLSELTDENKAMYIREIKLKLGPSLTPCIDVTPASPVYEARGLSTFFVKDESGASINSVWKEYRENYDPEEKAHGVYDFFYLTHLKPYQLGYVMDIKCFFDIYYNPTKRVYTPARALAVWQLLFKQHNLHYLENFNMFWPWYWANVGLMKEIE